MSGNVRTDNNDMQRLGSLKTVKDKLEIFPMLAIAGIVFLVLAVLLVILDYSGLFGREAFAGDISFEAYPLAYITLIPCTLFLIISTLGYLAYRNTSGKYESLQQAMKEQVSGTGREQLLVDVINGRYGRNGHYIALLGEMREPRAIDAMIEALRKGDTAEREEAAIALGKIGDKKSLTALEHALEDSDSTVRTMAMGSIASIEDEKVIHILIKALKNDAAPVRWIAAESLGMFLDDRAVEPLIEALKCNDNTLKKNAAKSLGMIGNPRAIEPLTEMLSDYDKEVKRAAAASIPQVGGVLPDWWSDRYLRK